MKFTEAERAILELFQNDTQFNFEGNTYKVNFAGNHQALMVSLKRIFILKHKILIQIK